MFLVRQGEANAFGAAVQQATFEEALLPAGDALPGVGRKGERQVPDGQLDLQQMQAVHPLQMPENGRQRPALVTRLVPTRLRHDRTHGDEGLAHLTHAIDELPAIDFVIQKPVVAPDHGC